MERSITHPTRPHTRGSGLGWGLVAVAMVAAVLTVFAGIAMSASAGATVDQADRTGQDNGGRKDDDHGNGDGHNGKNHKVALCHATHSFTNPYVMIMVDYHAVIMAGHGDHEGPVFTPTMDHHTKWGDIIPPFDFSGDAVYTGMNWTAEGQALFNNDCNVPTVPPTTTPPTTVTPTTVTHTTTPTTVTPTTLTPTTVTTPNESTTATTTGGDNGAISTTTTAVAENVVPTPAAAVPPVEVRGVSAERTQTPPTTGSLPVTGSTVTVLAMVATALIGAGAMALAARRRLDA